MGRDRSLLKTKEKWAYTCSHLIAELGFENNVRRDRFWAVARSPTACPVYSEMRGKPRRLDSRRRRRISGQPGKGWETTKSSVWSAVGALSLIFIPCLSGTNVTGRTRRPAPRPWPADSVYIVGRHRAELDDDFFSAP